MVKILLARVLTERFALPYPDKGQKQAPIV